MRKWGALRITRMSTHLLMERRRPSPTYQSTGKEHRHHTLSDREKEKSDAGRVTVHQFSEPEPSTLVIKKVLSTAGGPEVLLVLDETSSNTEYPPLKVIKIYDADHYGPPFPGNWMGLNTWDHLATSDYDCELRAYKALTAADLATTQPYSTFHR